MRKLDLTVVKPFVTLIVGYGTQRITAEIISRNVTPKNKADQVAILGASYVVAAIAADATTEHTNQMIDDFEEWYNTQIANRR